MTFGARSVSALTVSSLFGYTRLKPFTDKGVRPSWLLVSSNYIRKDAHGTRPQGRPSFTWPGRAEAAATHGAAHGRADGDRIDGLGYAVHEHRRGVNACNYINQGCFLSAYRPGTTNHRWVPIHRAWHRGGAV